MFVYLLMDIHKADIICKKFIAENVAEEENKRTQKSEICGGYMKPPAQWEQQAGIKTPGTLNFKCFRDQR